MKRTVGWLATVLLLAGWMVFFRPTFWGGPTTYVLVSGDSMLPTLEDSDFVVARESEYEIGDIVVFQIPKDHVGSGSLVIHRLVGGSASEGFVMQGDNRDAPDQWQPRPADLEGKLWLRIPKAGRVLLLLRSPLVLAAIAGVGAFLLVIRKKELGSVSDER